MQQMSFKWLQNMKRIETQHCNQHSKMSYIIDLYLPFPDHPNELQNSRGGNQLQWTSPTKSRHVTLSRCGRREKKWKNKWTCNSSVIFSLYKSISHTFKQPFMPILKRQETVSITCLSWKCAKSSSHRELEFHRVKNDLLGRKEPDLPGRINQTSVGGWNAHQVALNKYRRGYKSWRIHGTFVYLYLHLSHKDQPL